MSRMVSEFRAISTGLPPQMGRFKRSLQGGRPFLHVDAPPPKKAGILHEGFAIALAACPAVEEPHLPSSAIDAVGSTGEPKAYGRGSAARALSAISDPTACVARIWEDATARSSKGPFQSRKQLWESLARKAGSQDPFCLTPNLIFTVMGALKTAGYRSAEQYLDVAKAVHVSLGYSWSDQLAQARRLAIRSSRRGLGHPKQAGGLPLASLGLRSPTNKSQWRTMGPSGRRGPPCLRLGGCFGKSKRPVPRQAISVRTQRS